MGASAITYKPLKLKKKNQVFTRRRDGRHYPTWKTLKTNIQFYWAVSSCNVPNVWQIFNVPKEQNFNVGGLYWGFEGQQEGYNTGAEKMSAAKLCRLPNLLNWRANFTIVLLVILEFWSNQSFK